MDHHAQHLGPTSVTAGAVQAPPHRLRTLVERHPLPAFVILVLAFGWPIMSVPAMAQLGRATDSPLPTEPFALATTLLVLLPAALGVTAISEGRAAARELLRRALRWRFGAGWWAMVLGGLPTLALLAHLLVGASPTLSEAPSFLAGQLFQSATAVLIINLAEELAWAGFLQTRLEQRRGLPGAALATALPFALLHLPLLPLMQGPFWQNAGFVFVYAVVVRLLLGLTMRATGTSVLAVAVLHAVINQVNAASPALGLAAAATLAVLVALVLHRGTRGSDAR